jgi:hypothetical protein
MTDTMTSKAADLFKWLIAENVAPIARANFAALVDQAHSRDGSLYDYVIGYASNVEGNGHEESANFDDLVRAQFPNLDW